MASLSYFFGEATASLKRDRGSKLLAMLTIALAFFVLGTFLLVTSSLDHLTATWSASAEMSVYLRDEVSDDERAAIDSALAATNLIERREFVSKAEAARRFRRDFPDLAASAEGLAVNPLPASFEVRLRAAAMTTPETERLARPMRQMAGVSDVRYDRQWLDRLARLISILRWVGISLASALAVAAALTVAAVIASAGVIFICVHASDSTSGIEAVGDEPGLKSVASTTARPMSIICRAAG
jgi:cell division transport system permease protein